MARKLHQRLELNANYLFDTNLPIKVIFVGPPFSGKTTLAKSLTQYVLKQRGILKTKSTSRMPEIEPERRWKSKQFTRSFRDRTIGFENHLLEIDADLYLNIQDLAGHECFYTLHSIFLYNENSLFFVIFDLTKTREQLLEEISAQLKIILSHCTSDVNVNIVFIGTHLDKISFAKAVETDLLLRQIEAKFNIGISDTIFLNAGSPKKDKMINLLKSTRKLAIQVKNKLVSCFII